MIIDRIPQDDRYRISQLDYIAAHSLLAAVDQDDEIERQVELLLQRPKMGRPGRVKGTRVRMISRTPFMAVLV